MTRATIAGGVFAAVLVLLALGACRAPEEDVDSAAANSPAIPSTSAVPLAHESFLYGRITVGGGAAYEGRLRWGGDEEVFWGDYFNGSKDENSWVRHAPPERLPKERRQIEIFGLEIVLRERPIDLDRFFMARVGDIARIERRGVDVWVTLKSGTVFILDRLSAGDFDDGVRVWDGGGGFVDLDQAQIRTIEFLPTAGPGAVPNRLHGTVRTRHSEFTGFVQWDREEGVGSDELEGITADDGQLSLRFDAIRSISRHSSDSSQSPEYVPWTEVEQVDFDRPPAMYPPLGER